MDDQVKILFVQQVNDDEFQTESLWCTKKDDYYIIDNIPFIARRIALGDVIKALFDVEEDAFYFDEFIEVSGNSTIRLFFNDASLIELVRKELEQFGCESEVFPARKIVSVNVPKKVNYKPVKKFMDKGENENLWEYEESCLAHEY